MVVRKTGISRITATGQNRIREWFDKALADPSVFQFLGYDKRTHCPESDGDDDWTRLIYMDDANQGLMRITLDRQNGLFDISVSIWVLSEPQRSKRRVAGLLLSKIPAIMRQYGCSYIEATCHASNADSYKILKRNLGEPWGVKKEGGWNPILGAFEDTVHFRIKAQDWRKP